MIDWLKANETLIVSISGASVVVFLATLVVIPLLIVRMPADYFVREEVPLWPGLRREWPLALLGAKNLLGGILLLGGLAMLVLPGQGAMTILVGIMLLNFPGKRRFESWLIRRRAIHRMINWIRAKLSRSQSRYFRSVMDPSASLTSFYTITSSPWLAWRRYTGPFASASSHAESERKGATGRRVSMDTHLSCDYRDHLPKHTAESEKRKEVVDRGTAGSTGGAQSDHDFDRAM